MTKVLIDLSTVEKALDSLEYENSWHETYKVRPYVSTIDSIAALRAVLAEPVQETNDIVKQLADALDSVQFYQRRCEALQSWQSKMRDPERTIVCDILANGFTLDPAFAGDRYAAPPQRKPLTSDKDRPDQNATYVEGYGYVDTRAVRAVERAHGIKE